MKIGKTLYVTTRREWRAWLRKHHRTAKEIWLVSYRKETGKPRIPYDDAVEEALCFGWIDSIVKKVPGKEGASAQRYTPRRKGSPVSETNAARVRKLIDEGKMTKAGLAVLDPEVLAPKRLVLSPDVRAALRSDPQTWREYQALPEAYRRIRLGWIEGARKRPKVFRQRLAYFVKMTREGKRFGMVRR